MSDEMDPEVLADLELRSATERDKTRSRGNGVYSWQRPVIVARWPCRNVKCRAPVDVTQDAIDHLAMCNRWLAQRNEPPIATSEVVMCLACRELLVEWEARKNKRVGEDMAVAIRQLKASNNPETDADLLRTLKACKHPDLPGLLGTLRASLEARKRKPGRMGDV